MSDEETDVDPVEALSQQHKQQRKELQAQIQKIKHEVPKGDKRRKKEATERIAILQAELDERQEKEMDDLQNSQKLTNKVAQQLDALSVENDTTEVTESDSLGDLAQAKGDSQQTRTSKAQKRRDKKAAKEKEREERIKQQAVENLTGARHLEYQRIKEILKTQNLQVFEIKSDGNCLYNAVNHQLKPLNLGSSNEELRQKTASFMKENKDDFLPFLTKDDGNPFSENNFNKYCDDTATTTAWGGQHEVRALSHVFKLPIEIIQAEGPPIKIGEEYEVKGKSDNIVLCYHRHFFGLGEHYNSVEELKEENEDEFNDDTV